MDKHLEEGMRSPSRKRRLACLVYEALLLFGVLFVAAYLFDTLTQSRHALTLRHTRQAWLFIVLGVYFVWFWRHGGQTLAMKTWHLKLVTERGQAVSYPQAIGRYCLSVVFTPTGLAFLYSFFDPNGQFPQDRLLKTRVVLSKPRARGVEQASIH